MLFKESGVKGDGESFEIGLEITSSMSRTF